jgi:phosphate transport system substrate-binding protein
MNKIQSKNYMALIVMIMIACLAFAGCGSRTASDAGYNQDSGQPSTPALSGTVTTAGSTSVQPLSEELAAAFMSKNPQVRIEVAGGGSGAGVKAAQTNTADLGAASRELKAEETGIKAITIAIDGIAVIVNPQNTAADLTMAQIKDIFTGNIKNWKEVGGNDAQITVVNREDGSGTRSAFDELVLKGEKFIDTAIIQNSTGAVSKPYPRYHAPSVISPWGV